MNEINLPETYNYAEAYLTFRCNFNCSYCINKQNGIIGRSEMSPQQWINALNRINFGNVSLTLGGGEPTVYKGFYEILKGLKPEIKIDLLTNLQFDVNEFLQKVTPDRFTKNPKPFYHSIRVSYHPEQSDRKEIIDKAALLQKNGFSIGIFGIGHPYYINENMETGFYCSRAGVPFYVKDFLGHLNNRLYGFYKYPEGLDGNKKICECRTRELLIAPNGNIYRCHRDLYADENPVGNVLDENHEPRYTFRLCSNFGECNPCDVKMKTNRFLREIDCQVEIKDSIENKEVNSRDRK